MELNEEVPVWDEKVQIVLDRMLKDYTEDVDEPVISTNNRSFSPRQITEGYREGDPFLRRFCRILAGEYEKYEEELVDETRE